MSRRHIGAVLRRWRRSVRSVVVVWLAILWPGAPTSAVERLLTVLAAAFGGTIRTAKEDEEEDEDYSD